MKQRLTDLLQFSALLFLLAASPLHSTIWYVDSSVESSGAGTSWETSFKSIQEGIDAASSGEEVWVKAGTYHPTDDIDQEISITMAEGVDLYGGFTGTETTRDQRDWEINETILSGDIGVENNMMDNSYHVVFAADAIIDGFIIEKGYAYGAGNGYVDPNGNNSTSVEAILYGTGFSTGGGMECYQTYPDVVNCTFRGNKARKGGAVYVMGATDTNANSIFDAPTFTNCTFKNNSASIRGGAISIDVRTDITVTNCTFISNSCDEKGGALYFDWSCDGIFTNSVFAENTTNTKGGVAGIDGSSNPTFINCTFANNTALDQGAGVYMGSYLTTPNLPTFINCIFWGNATIWPGPQDISTWHEDWPTLTNAIVEQGFNGTNVNMDDPQFVDANNGDYTLTSSSPAIDAADTLSANATDLDGNGRRDIPGGYEATEIGTYAADLGAYEYQPDDETPTFSEWAFNKGLTAEDDDLTDDPASDDISNLMKYALNLEPATTYLQSDLFTYDLGESELTITYTCLTNPWQVNIYIETSDDLSTWTNAGSESITASNTDTQTRKVSLTANEDKAFVRLTVESLW